jgi:hypothetical protein
MTYIVTPDCARELLWRGQEAVIGATNRLLARHHTDRPEDRPMRRFRFLPVVVLALLAAPSAARAQLGVDFTTPVDFTNNSWSLGWSFTASTMMARTG